MLTTEKLILLLPERYCAVPHGIKNNVPAVKCCGVIAERNEHVHYFCSTAAANNNIQHSHN